MKMTKRLVACSMVTALLAGGCKKKHDDPGASASPPGSSASGTSGDGAAVAPSPAVSAASALATSTQQALVATANKLKAAPVTEQAAAISKLIDASIASGQSQARDRSWDPASVIKSVGTDRAKLFAWVHDQTRLVPYTGILRGSVGVMMDRVGNSLDRSLLLANLLKQAGGETRLAHATLDQANADKLAAEWWKATPPSIAATADDPGIAASLIAALGEDPAAIQKRLAGEAAMRADIASKARAQIDTEVGALAKLIEGTPLAAPTDSAVLADHWWVQVKDGEAWTDLDLAESAPGTSLVQATETMATTDVPETMRHTLAIRVIGEVWHDGKREESTLVDHAFTPAEYFGQRLTVTGAAVDLPDWDKLDDEKDRAAAVHASFVSQVEWFPMIVMGATPIVHYSVDDNGEIYDLMDPNAATTRLGRGVARATKNGVGGATDMLAGMPDGTGSAPPPAKPVIGAHSGFTAEWVEIEVRAPNTPPRVVRRPLFDELGAPADRSSLKPTLLSDAAKFDRTLAMLGEIEVLPQFARTPRGYLSNQLATYLTIAKPALVALVQSGGKHIPDDLKAAVNTALSPPDELDELGFERFFAAGNTFIDRLDVLTARRRLVSVNGTMRRRQTFDIVTNGVGAWGAPADARKARLAQGIADTVMESVLLPCIGDNDACFRGPNTSEAFINAKSWSMTASPTPAVAGLPVDARKAATSDLASGYSLVLPPDGKPVTWWRVRGDTGEVLGQGAVGGISETESLIILRMQVFGYGAGLGFCAVGYRGIRFMGCVTALELGAASLGTTGILSAALGLAATLIGGLSTTTPYREP